MKKVFVGSHIDKKLKKVYKQRNALHDHECHKIEEKLEV